MQRIPEPELMQEPAQAAAYAAADFDTPHQRYVTLFLRLHPGLPAHGTILDLGCGTGDVLVRFARALPRWRAVGVDGSAAMLARARQALRAEPGLSRRIRLLRGIIPETRLPRQQYDLILSSSFLHHLHDPQALWVTVGHYARRGTILFVPDLRRPATAAIARQLVAKYARGEPAILRRDFYNSLRAAFTPAEVRHQLRTAGLDGLRVRAISNRHLLVDGRIG